jgi:hypothetical protein
MTTAVVLLKVWGVHLPTDQQNNTVMTSTVSDWPPTLEPISIDQFLDGLCGMSELRPEPTLAAAAARTGVSSRPSRARVRTAVIAVVVGLELLGALAGAAALSADRSAALLFASPARPIQI